MIDEMPDCPSLEEGDAPPIDVLTRATSPACESGEAENDVGRRIAIHAEQLAHEGSPEESEDTWSLTVMLTGMNPAFNNWQYVFAPKQGVHTDPGLSPDVGQATTQRNRLVSGIPEGVPTKEVITAYCKQ